MKSVISKSFLKINSQLGFVKTTSDIYEHIFIYNEYVILLFTCFCNFDIY